MVRVMRQSSSVLPFSGAKDSSTRMSLYASSCFSESALGTAKNFARTGRRLPSPPSTVTVMVSSQF